MSELLAQLNDKQQEAVRFTEGPLLILAGAGSGKTRVLTYRMAYLIQEKGVMPWNILAITFTNKAAGEMRTRVDSLIGPSASGIWVSTFHAMCVRILRRHIDRIGYDRSFTIYDTDDSRTLMRSVIKTMNIDSKMFRERSVLAAVSSAKNQMIGVKEYEQEACDYREEVIARLYREYQAQLKNSNALDFDDLLLETIRLFETCPDVLAEYRNRFRYIMVDEYQDTNRVQFELVRALAGENGNLCVVGDDDQSIYKFRGADIRNILSFEESFPGAKVVKLEQNYRSTGKILDTANAVIANNRGRKEKSLWTDNGTGEPIEFHQYEDGNEEACSVVGDIAKRFREGCSYNDFAILYRTNAQSRLFEEQMVRRSIPYKLVGGVNFYARREIKDVLAYLKTIESGRDEIALKRIINVPRRGIGDTTIGRIEDYARANRIGLFEAMERVGEIRSISRGKAKIDSFVLMIRTLRKQSEEMSLLDLFDSVLEATGYRDTFETMDEDEAEDRLDNLAELRSKLADFMGQCADNEEEATLSAFLQDVALVTDLDLLEDEADYVVLMTLHGAKGLEFDQVYMTGMEDGVFPGFMTITSGEEEEMEEERRLCYVGITRARKRLTLTCARRRMLRGETRYFNISRFVGEIPVSLLDDRGALRYERKREERKQERYGWNDDSFPGSFHGSGEMGSARRNAVSGASSYLSKPKSPKQFSVPAGTKPAYDVGDRVKSAKFGEGTVTGMVKGGRDYEVTVDFDGAGTKKMFAAFAKLEKL